MLCNLPLVANLLPIPLDMEQNMPQDRMMQAIGRIERAVARLEAVNVGMVTKAPLANTDLQQRYDHLRTETQAAIGEIDQLLSLVKD